MNLRNCSYPLLAPQENRLPHPFYSSQHAVFKYLFGYTCTVWTFTVFFFIFASFSNSVFHLFTPLQALSSAPSGQLSYIYTPISNNRPSTAPRGLQHAILKISISAELFRETLKSVCASGNRHEPSASQRGKPRGDVGDGERDGGEGEDKGNKEKIDQNWIKQNSI